MIFLGCAIPSRRFFALAGVIVALGCGSDDAGATAAVIHLEVGPLELCGYSRNEPMPDLFSTHAKVGLRPFEAEVLIDGAAEVPVSFVVTTRDSQEPVEVASSMVLRLREEEVVEGVERFVETEQGASVELPYAEGRWQWLLEYGPMASDVADARVQQVAPTLGAAALYSVLTCPWSEDGGTCRWQSADYSAGIGIEFTDCTPASPATEEIQLDSDRGTATFSVQTVRFGGPRPHSLPVLTSAEGMLDGQPFRQHDPFSLAVRGPDYEELAVLFDAPIGSACGLLIDQLSTIPRARLLDCALEVLPQSDLAGLSVTRSGP